MATVLVGPNGLKIRGTLELLSGVALIHKCRMENGRIEFEHYGEIDIWYDETRTAENENGETLLVDTDGNEWPESQLKLGTRPVEPLCGFQPVARDDAWSSR